VTDPDLGVRVAAIAHLPVYTDVEASKAVRAFLNDPAPGVRGAAVMAYGRLAGDPGNDLRLDAAMAIIPLLDDPEVRTGAAEILGRLGMNVAARPMLKLLNVRDESVRTVALRALGEFEDKDTALPVVAVLRDPSPSVRTAAARTLGRIADVRTTPALVAALSDGEPSVRGASAWALGRIGDRRAVPALIDLLKHPNERVQASAAEALGEIGDPSAVDAIGELLARNSRIGTAAATIALRRLRDSRSIRSLSAYLLEPAPREVPRQAAEALAAIPDPEAIEALVRVACSPGTHDQARLEARRALGDAVGRGFLNEPPETIRKWWEQNREDYMRPLPAAD
jgi:HEAT repeat protein